MLPTQAEELEEVLEEGEEFILSLAVRQKEGEEDGEFARSNHYLAGYLFC